MPDSTRAKSGIFLSAILSVLLLGAIGFGALVVFHVRSSESANRYNRMYYSPPAQPAYPQAVHPSYPVYPPVQLAPMYPEYDGHDEHYHHHDEQGR